ncbi:MAG: HDOD domain-containing protein [Methylophaga sp.]|nr:HDOD domain-containing protein [Methylophaga sp.]
MLNLLGRKKTKITKDNLKLHGLSSIQSELSDVESVSIAQQLVTVSLVSNSRLLKQLPEDCFMLMSLVGDLQSVDDASLVNGPLIIDTSLLGEIQTKSECRASLLTIAGFHQLTEPLQRKLILMANKRLFERQGLLTKQALDLEDERQRIAAKLLERHLFNQKKLTNAEFVKNIISRIPKLPVSSLELLTELHSDSINIKKATELVVNDPSLSSLLLKTINSGQFRLREMVVDVAHAIRMVGFNGVYSIVISQSIKKSLPDTPEFRKIADKSIELSNIAFALARLTARVQPSHAATIGLLAQIGMIVRSLLIEQNPKLSNLIELINEYHLGAKLLAAWRLPYSITDVIEQLGQVEYAQPNAMRSSTLDMVAVIHIAQCMTEILHRQPVSGLYANEYSGLLGIEESNLEVYLRKQLIPGLLSQSALLPKAFIERLEVFTQER